MTNTHVLQARFDEFGLFERALHKLKDSGVEHYEASGPVNLTELEGVMPRQGSPVRIVSTLGAITGLVSFFLMCVLSSLLYHLITGGKLPISRVPFVIIAYEGTILLGALAAFLGFLVFTRLYPAKKPEAHDEAVTGDTFGIRVTCPPDQKDRIISLLKDAGAIEINESQY